MIVTIPQNLLGTFFDNIVENNVKVCIINSDSNGATLEIPDTAQRVCYFAEVLLSVQEYFENEEALITYEPVDVVFKSIHEDDKHLFIVNAVNLANHTWTCWTCWNQSTKSLNHGHYDLETHWDAIYIACQHSILE